MWFCLMSASSDSWRKSRASGVWGDMVCLCSAPLEISVRALCVLQRDDKTNRALQSSATQRTQLQTRGGSDCFYSTQSPRSRARVWECSGKEKKGKNKDKMRWGHLLSHLCVWVTLSGICCHNFTLQFLLCSFCHDITLWGKYLNKTSERIWHIK